MLTESFQPAISIQEEKLQTIKQLKTIFGGCDQFILTGSTVLQILGLTTNSDDIDIVLKNVKEDTIELLKRQVKDYPVHKTETNQRLEKDGVFVFRFNGTKVDVFTRDPKDYNSTLQFEGITISPVKSIVEAKKGYHRVKYLLQLKALAAFFFRQEDLENELKLIQQKESYK